MPESLDPLAFTTPQRGDTHPDAVLDPFDMSLGESAAEADHLPSEMEAFQPPAASLEQIPDDWDMTDYGTSPVGRSAQPREGVALPSPGAQRHAPASPVARPASPAARVPPQPARPIPTPPVAPQPFIPTEQPETPQSVKPSTPPPVASAASAPAGGEDLFAAFLRGAGIDPAVVDQGDAAATMQRYGALFREVVQGLMEVLMARASLKSEFRMMLTTIRPVENNPLKFSPSVDDAMRNLFMSRGGGYLSPIESVREGFEDIKNHQMAMVAGMQAAFRDMMERLKPESFEKNNKGGGVRGALMPTSRKSHAWEAYCDFYNTIMRDPESSFQTLFGEEFAQAYEEQVKRLTLLRNK
jgi:type VI secretion system protein